MIVLPNTGYLISCSLDKSIIKTDVINEEGKIGEKVHSHALTCILPDHQSRRFFVADVVGSVFIYSSEVIYLGEKPISSFTIGRITIITYNHI